MPAWSIPRTWVNTEVVGETEMNTHVRDNLDFLKNPSFQQIVTASAGNYSTTATTAVPIDTANLSITLTTYGGAVHFFFGAQLSGQGIFHLFMTYDGTAFWDNTTGLLRIPATDLAERFRSFEGWITGLASGSHTFRPFWRSNAGPNTAFCNIASAPAIFWIREG